MIEGVEACDDIAISTTTSMLVEPSVEESSDMNAIVDVCSNDSAHVIDDEVSDVVAKLDQHSGEVHFVDNPMFDTDATLSYDNPLFEVKVDHSPEWSWTLFSPSVDSVQFLVGAVGDVPTSTDFDVATRIVDTIGISACGSPIATSFCGFVGDDQDSTLVYIMWVVTKKKSMLRFLVELSSSDALTFALSTQVQGATLQAMLMVLMILACNWFSVDRDATCFFIWDPGGGWSSLCC